MPEKEIVIEIKNVEVLLILVLLFGFFILELQVSFNNPIVFGDEGFHTRISQWIAENKEYPVWKPFGTPKTYKSNFSGPALWNLLMAGLLYIFGFNEIIIRFLPPFIAFLTALVVFIFVKKFYNDKMAIIAAIIVMTIPSFVTYSVLIYKDVLVTLFSILFLFLFILGSKTEKKIYWVVAGIFGFLAFMTKLSGLSLYLFSFLVLLYEITSKRKYQVVFKKYSPLFLTLILFSSTYFLRNFYYHGTPGCGIPYFSSIFDTSGCTINEFEGKYEFSERTEMTGTEQSVYSMGIMNYFNFAYGYNNLGIIALSIVMFSFFCGVFIIFYRKKPVDIFIIIMLLILLPSLNYSSPRAEDAARYTLLWVPIIAIVSAKYFDEIYKLIKKYQKHIALVVFIFVVYFSYQNLIEKLDVMARVKQFSPSFFEACDWVKENTNENITLTTVWVHRAVYNCQRNAIGHAPDIFLSRDENYTKEVAKKTGVTHIFVQKFSIGDRPMAERYSIDSIQFFEDNPDTFKKVFENGPPLEQCLQQGGCDGNIIYEIIY